MHVSKETQALRRYPISEKLYNQAGAQAGGAQGGAGFTGGAQAGGADTDPNVVDADYEVVDDNGNK